MTPYQLDRAVSEQQEAARHAGDREACLVAYWDSWTSRADCWVYTAASLGIPVDYCDPTSGIWSVPEDVCWQCWKPIEGPVTRLMVNAECRHYHPECLSSHDSQLREGEHTSWSCRSTIPHYVA
jgi:hypothetical protein